MQPPQQASSSPPPPVEISSSRGSYPVFVGRGLLGQVGTCIRSVPSSARLGRRCAIVSDSNTARLYGDGLLASLDSAGFEPFLAKVPAGEASKSLEQAGWLCDQFAARGLNRSSFVMALGGGVIGDLAGFSAAIYCRGIQCMHVPTTVTSQVDSAIGGKTGVNTARAKNLIGAFYPPSAVIADVDALRTLPGREFRQGWAEIIKHAAIADANLFARLALLKPDPSGDPNDWLPIIRRNVEIKGGIVSADEFERTGQRALLNFGHTIGHAVESAAGYGHFFHGEAISLGMVAAAWLSERKAGLSPDDTARLLALLDLAELPTRLTDALPLGALEKSLRLDKKFLDGQIRFVLLSRLGEARLSEPGEITWEDIQRAIEVLRPLAP